MAQNDISCRDNFDAAEALISFARQKSKDELAKTRDGNKGDVAGARAALEQLLNSFDHRNRGNLAILMAVTRGNEDWLSYLLSAGCQLAKDGERQPTYIHEALRYRQSQMAVELCDIAPGLVKAIDDKGRSTVHAAILSGDIDALEHICGVSVFGY